MKHQLALAPACPCVALLWVLLSTGPIGPILSCPQPANAELPEATTRRRGPNARQDDLASNLWTWGLVNHSLFILMSCSITSSSSVGMRRLAPPSHRLPLQTSDASHKIRGSLGYHSLMRVSKDARDVMPGVRPKYSQQELLYDAKGLAMNWL